MQKALRGLEIGVSGLDPTFEWDSEGSVQAMRHELANPGPRRLWCVADAFRSGMSIEEVFQVSKIDPWFLAQIEDLVWDEARLTEMALSDLDRDSLWRLKRKGFSDKRLAVLLDVSEKELRERRLKLDVRPVYKRVDTVLVSLRHQPPISIQPMKKSARRTHQAVTRLWFWVVVQTESVRVLNLIIAVFMPRLQCVRMGMKPLW